MKKTKESSKKRTKQEKDVDKVIEETKKQTWQDKKENKILYIIKNNIIFIIGTILLIFKGMFLNYVLGLQIEQNTILYLCCSSLLIMSPAINCKNKFGYLYLNIIYFIVSIIIYANYLYFTYSTNFLSFYQLENLKYAKEIGAGLSYVINIKNLAMFLTDNIILAVLSIIAYKKFRKTYYKNRIVKALIMVILIVLNSNTIKDKIDYIYADKGYNKSLIVQSASIFYYHYEDAKDYFSNLIKQPEIDTERLTTAYKENQTQKTDKTKYTGIAKDSNVIILQLESLNQYIIGKKVNGKEITPNLNKFFSENIYCTDMYNQGLGSTADSEFEMENSLYPLENGYVFQKYYGNTWMDIFSTLKNEEYYTSFMHPNTSTFWNRESVYNNGYNIDEYDDINKFPNIERAGEFYSDEGFLDEAVKIMNSYEQKFCSTLVTVTTHIAFSLDGISDLDQKTTITRDDLEGYTDEIYKNYIISCNFTDYAFGKFMEELEETGLLENTILVVYGDHGAGMSLDDTSRLYQENGMVFTEYDNITKDVHVPFGIKIPHIDNNEDITRCVSKIDIKPTILDLLGIKDEFSIGTSIFSNKDYAFVKGLGFFTSKNYCINDIYYDRKTQIETVEIENLKNLQEKMENEIYLSDTIIKNNLLNNGKIFKIVGE